MLSCITVGISEYENKDLIPISCAAEDARAVYDAFRQIMGPEFNNYLSICVSNIRSADFESLLCAISDVMEKESEDTNSILVIYFSGHGAFDDTCYELRFAEYRGTGRNHDDVFSAEQFSKIFRGKHFKILIILDCCNSGAALPVANVSDQGPEISVLAAVNSYQSATFDENGSVFTNILCKSICELDSSGEIFSLESLIHRMQTNGYHRALVHRGAAQKLDLVFRNPAATAGIDQYFPFLFIDKIAHGDMLSREALWYSLSNFSDQQVLKTCEYYFDTECKYGRKLEPEASWLVRRAIGSTLANHVSNPGILELLLCLLESEYWQEQCIALIGLRYLIRKDDEIFKRVIRLVADKTIRRVDAVWLASLYTSDNTNSDWRVFLDTTLALTPWGMIELCKSHKLLSDNLDSYDCLCGHSFYKALIEEQKRQAGRGNSKLEKCVYSGETRGRLPENTQSKFLLSALYGNWRDQISCSLKPYIESYGSEQISAELKAFSCVDNAERKMAVFTYFIKEHEEAIEYADALKWGLNDIHPWVRRTAMECYKKLELSDIMLKESLFSLRVNEGYPGYLDFYLTCPSNMRQDLINHLNEQSDLSKGDIRSLEQSFSNK